MIKFSFPKPVAAVLIILISCSIQYCCLAYPFTPFNGNQTYFLFSNPKLGFQIDDLATSGPTTFLRETYSWTAVGVSGTKITTCNNITMLGGPNILSRSGYFERTYTSLPSHDIIYFRIQLYIIDNWQSPDTIIIQINNTNFTAGDIALSKGNFQSNFCGNSAYPDLANFAVVGKAYHNSSAVRLRIISQMSQTPDKASFGVGRVSLLFGIKTSTDVQGSCNVANISIVSNSCGCPNGTYQDPTNALNCLPCHQYCADCYGPSNTQCYACNASIGSSYNTNKCIKCAPNCKDCSWTGANNCIKCFDNAWHRWDYSCPTTCDSPNQVIVDAVKLCEPSCSSGQYQLTNGTCAGSCPSPLSQWGNDLGKFCQLPCANSMYQYPNGSCIANCSSPFLVNIVQSVLIQCVKPCQTGAYLYPDLTCSQSCPSPFINTTQDTIARCNAPCSSSQFYYSDGTCKTTCDSPYIKNTTNPYYTRCDKPCPSGQYLNQDGSCSQNCTAPFVSTSQDGIDYCKSPCSASEFLYPNNNCRVACDSPFVKNVVNANLTQCKRPCQSGQYLYPDKTCAQNCDSPFTSSSQDGIDLCNAPCLSSQFYYSDGTCKAACDSPYIKNTSNSYYTKCDKPCLSGQYLNQDGSCSQNCTAPLVSVSQDGIDYCKSPCSTSEFLYPNNSCRVACDSPFVKNVVNANLTQCKRPCQSGEYLYSDNICSQNCESPFTSSSEDGIDYCNAPCLSSEFLYSDGTCKTRCNSPFIKNASNSYYTRCEKPCSSSIYLNQDDSCSQNCDSPFISVNLDGIDYCKSPCSSSEFLYPNNSCRTACDSPFIREVINVNLTQCKRPCRSGEYVNPDGSCSQTCDHPFTSITQDEILYRIAPCSDPPKYYDPVNNVCLASCDSPYEIQAEQFYNSCTKTEADTTVDSIKAQPQLAVVGASIFETGLNIVTTTTAIAMVIGSINPGVASISGFLKMLPYIRYMNVSYPDNLQVMLDRTNSSFVSFSFGIDMPTGLEAQFPKYALPGKFGLYQLHSSFIVNYWETMISFMIVFGIVAVICIGAALMKRHKEIQEIFQGLKIIAKWNFCIMVFFSNLNEVVLSSSLELHTFSGNSAQEIISLLFCIFIMITTISLLVLGHYIIPDIRKRKNQIFPAKYKDHSFSIIPEEKWKSYQIFHKGSKSDLLIRHIFLIPYLGRILLFHMIIAFLYNYPLFQAASILFLSVLTLLYILITKPFVSKLVLYQLITNEITMLIVNVTILALAILDHNNAGSSAFRANLGTLIIYLNIIVIFMSNFYLLTYLAIGFRDAYRRMKVNKKKGILAYITTLLSPYESRGMNVVLEVPPPPPEAFVKTPEIRTNITFKNIDLITEQEELTGNVERIEYSVLDYSKDNVELVGETLLTVEKLQSEEEVTNNPFEAKRPLRQQKKRNTYKAKNQIRPSRAQSHASSDLITTPTNSSPKLLPKSKFNPSLTGRLDNLDSSRDKYL